MKYSFNWLKELSQTKKSAEKVAELVNMHAFELEDIQKLGGDIQLEFNILPNRGHDALSHFGIAREIRAVEERKFSEPTIEKISSGLPKLDVQIRDGNLCSRYIGAVIEGIQVKPSPEWMKKRLEVCDLNPINNIVDITNYVMLELGQPMHAFDAKKTTGNIVVRKAENEEKIKLLDEKIYELSNDNLVIADSNKPIALAGIMGGLASSVTKKTKSIILESANFNARNIRKTRTALGIQTESSYRFERQIDPNLAKTGLERAVELILAYGGKNVKITAFTDVYPKKLKSWKITLDTKYANSLLGEKIEIAKMKKILVNLGLKVKVSGKNLECQIPTRRLDLGTPEDLIEEIGRIYGYENIPACAPRLEISAPRENRKLNFVHDLRDTMTGLEFSEVYNYSFYGQKEIENFGFRENDHIEVANPMNPDQQFMRWSLIPNLVKNIQVNAKYSDKFSIFEIGKKYYLKKGKPAEKNVLAGAEYNPSAKDELFFILKGKLEALLSKMNYHNFKIEPLKKPEHFWHPARSAAIIIKGIEAGRIGEIDTRILEKYNIKNRAVVFGMRVEDLLNVHDFQAEFQPISKFPSVERDISMFVEKNTTYADIEKKIKKSGGNMLKSVELFDVFEKDGKKSLALRLKIGSAAKTLTSAEIDAVMKKITFSLEKELKVKVRK